MVEVDERDRLSIWLGEPGHRAASQGEALFWSGDLDGALASFDESARRDPADAWVYLSRAAVRFTRGERDIARKDFDEFRRRRPSGASCSAVEAILAASDGNAEAARKSADDAVERSSRAAWALALRGTLRGRWGDLDAARDDLDAALARETLPWALAARADTLNRIGYFWLALEDLDRLRQLLPGDPEPDVIAAAIHRDQAQYADALRRLKRAEAQRPGESRFSRLRAEVLFVQGKIGAAQVELGRALKLSPGDTQLRFEHIRLLALARRDAEAEKALKTAGLPKASHDFLLAYLRARARRWKDAAKLFDGVVRDGSPEAGHLRERATLYRQVCRVMPHVKAPPRPKTKEFRMTGLGYRQPIQTSVDALRYMISCDVLYSNLSDASVVDFVGLFGLPFKAIVFRRSDQEAFKAAADVMPGFKTNHVVGIVTRGHPLFYGRLARRVAVLAWRRGYSVRVPASTSIADTIPALTGVIASPRLGVEVRDCSDLVEVNPKLPLVLYNFTAVGSWRADLARRLSGLYGPDHTVFLLPGYGDREFFPVTATTRTLEAELQKADEAVTLYLPARGDL